jgi:hypothetical protein
MKTTVYNMDMRSGALRPIQNPHLAIGQIVTYEDRANPRHEAVVISAEFDGHGQKCIFLDDGHESIVSEPGTDGHAGWQMGDRILTTTELVEWIQTAQVNKARIAEETRIASEEKARARETLRGEYLRDFGGFLDRITAGNYRGHSVGARNLKRELIRAFPGIEFSVKSKSYSGGDSIDVSWELGPTTAAVKAISDKYQECDFNGMEDIEEYRDNLWPEIFGGAKYVSESRGDTGAMEIVAAALCERWKITPPADGKSFWNIYPSNDHRGGNDIGCIARQILFAQSYPAGAAITGIEETGEHAGQWHDILRATFTAPQAITPTPVAAPAPEPVPEGKSAAGGITVKFNQAKNGVEIHFPGKPSAGIISELKAKGWRWSRFNSCWYAHRNSLTVTYAVKLAGLTDDQSRALFGAGSDGPDRFDMQVEDNMREACGL